MSFQSSPNKTNINTNSHALHEITQRIASICKLDWFSTEIALTLEEFVVVDYVNDGIDTRVQSKAVDGVPDEVMQNIAEQLVRIAKGETYDTRAGSGDSI